MYEIKSGLFFSLTGKCETQNLKDLRNLDGILP